MNKYLAIDYGGYFCINSLCAIITVCVDCGCFPENRSVREVKCKVHWAVLRTGYYALYGLISTFITRSLFNKLLHGKCYIIYIVIIIVYLCILCIGVYTCNTVFGVAF